MRPDRRRRPVALRVPGWRDTGATDVFDTEGNGPWPRSGNRVEASILPSRLFAWRGPLGQGFVVPGRAEPRPDLRFAVNATGTSHLMSLLLSGRSRALRCVRLGKLRCVRLGKGSTSRGQRNVRLAGNLELDSLNFRPIRFDGISSPMRGLTSDEEPRADVLIGSALPVRHGPATATVLGCSQDH